MHLHKKKKQSIKHLFKARLLTVLVSLLSLCDAWGQQPDAGDEKVTTLLEDLLGRDDARSIDFETLVDLEQALRRRPINLNHADEEDVQNLVALQLLSETQATALLEYRQQLGPFTSIYELQAVPLLDVPTIRRLLPYVRVSDDLTYTQLSARELLTGGQSTFLVRAAYVMPKERGYFPQPGDSKAAYLGSPYSLYTRYRYAYGTKFSAGITAQKDAGEEFFKGSQPHGFDFYSAHLYYKGNSIIRAAALGDYAVNIGQGLITGAGFGVVKSSYVSAVKNGGRILWPYTSIDEFQFLRGAALTLGTGHWQLTSYASWRKADGNLVHTDTLDENRIITSIGGDGLHRTESELADRNAVTIKVGGAHLQYSSPTFSAGLCAQHTRFSLPFHYGNEPYQSFYFRGTELTHAGFHFDWSYRNFNWFGEAAYSSPSGHALLSGLLISLHPRVDVVSLYRNYSRDYTSLFSTALSEGTLPQNESGFYGGLVFRFLPTLTLSGYADLYEHPWLRYRTDAPSAGQDYLLQLTYKPSKQAEYYVRWRRENQLQNASLPESPQDLLTEETRSSLRLHGSYALSPAVVLRSRVEFSWYRHSPQPAQNGVLIYQDVIWKQLGSPLQLIGRFALFDASDYEARIYAYENDVLYVYSVPAFYYRGIRSYLLARYSFSRALDVWVRLATTYYSNRDRIGSGLSEIEGPVKSEIKAELRLRF